MKPQPFIKGEALFARIYTGDRRSLRLHISAGAARKFGLDRQRGWDLFWEVDSQAIVLRPGSQRFLHNNGDRAWPDSYLYITSFIKQFDLPVLRHRLPMSGTPDEIWVDYGDVPAKRFEDEGPKTERMNVHLGKKSDPESMVAMRAGKKTVDMFKKVAKREGKSYYRWVLESLVTYVEDYYPEVWHSQ